MRKQSVPASTRALNIGLYPGTHRHQQTQIMAGYYIWVTLNVRRLYNKETLGL